LEPKGRLPLPEERPPPAGRPPEPLREPPKPPRERWGAALGADSLTVPSAFFQLRVSMPRTSLKPPPLLGLLKSIGLLRSSLGRFLSASLQMNLIFSSRSSLRASPFSSGVMKVLAIPFLPARPVRPMR